MNVVTYLRVGALQPSDAHRVHMSPIRIGR
jgi:hypothetical protein